MMSFLKSLTLLMIFLFKGTALAESVPTVTKQQMIKAGLEQPTALAIDKDGRLFVVDGGHHRVAVLSPAGQFLYEIKGAAAGLFLPMDIALDNNRLAVADSGNKRVVIFDLQGHVIKTIHPEFARQPKRKYNDPRPVAVFLKDEVVYWSDQANHQVCAIALAAEEGVLARCFGQRGETDGQFEFPFQIASDKGGYLHIVDVLNARIQVFNSKGRFFSQIARFGLNADELYRPNGVAIDDNDTVFIADNYFGTISMFRGGRFLGKLQDQTGKILTFNSPTGLYWRDQQLYVVDTPLQAVYRLQLDTQQSTAVAPKAPQRIEVSQKNCVICHLDWADEHTRTTPSSKPEVMAVASSKMCYSCHHGVVMDSRLLIKQGSQHPSVDDLDKDKTTLKHMDERKDKLPKVFPLTENKEMRCTTCHTPHNSEDQHETLHHENTNAWLRVTAHDGDLCERCHESKQKNARELDAKKRGLNHPLAIIFDKAGKPDAPGYVKEEKLVQGLPEALKTRSASLDSRQRLICQSCHQVHGGKDNELVVLGQQRGELCMQCHESKSSKNKKDAHRKGIHPVNEKLEKPIKRKDEKITHVSCQSCHKVHSGSTGTPLLPSDAKNPDDICADCHQRQAAKNKEDARHKGVHPVNFKLEEPLTFGKQKIQAITCSTCHSVHEGSPGTAALVNNVKDTEAICEDCHKRQHAGDKDKSLPKGLHPVAGKLDKPVKINKTEVKKLGCLSCHSVHKGIKETPALVEAYKNGELCEHCHVQKQAVIGTDHDLRITAKDKKNHYGQLPVESGVCGSCHSMHQQEGTEKQTVKKLHLDAVEPVANLQSAATIEQGKPVKRDAVTFKEDRLCLNCHQQDGIAQKKVINHFGHPSKDIILRSDKNVMPLLDSHEKVKEFGAIACITCHDPHAWKPLEKKAKVVLSTNKANVEGTLLNSFLRHKDIKGTFCLSCHGLEALPKYKYYHDGKLVRDIGVEYLK